MGQLGVGLPTFPHHTKVNLSPLSRAEPLQEATGLPRKDETSEKSVRNINIIYINCLFFFIFWIPSKGIESLPQTHILKLIYLCNLMV